MNVDLSIVIVNWNTRQLLLDCLASVYGTIKEISFEVWVVDNASKDGSVQALTKLYPLVKIIENKRNLGFAAANNKALCQINGKYALLLNTDTILTQCAIEKIHSFMEKTPEAGMACGQLLNNDGSKQNSIANFPSLITLLFNETLLRVLLPRKFPSKRRDYLQPIKVDSCIGACLMVRKKAMDEVGLLDERYFFFMEETDWALSMKKAGWWSWFVPDARIYHLQGQTAGDNAKARVMFYRSRYSYFQRWHPGLFHLMKKVLLVKLVINYFLNLLGCILTLGFYKSIREKLKTYGILLGWHFQGCPENK